MAPASQLFVRQAYAVPLKGQLASLAAGFTLACKRSQPNISWVSGELCSSALSSPATWIKPGGRRGQSSLDCCASGEPITLHWHSSALPIPEAQFNPGCRRSQDSPKIKLVFLKLLLLLAFFCSGLLDLNFFGIFEKSQIHIPYWNPPPKKIIIKKTPVKKIAHS